MKELLDEAIRLLEIWDMEISLDGHMYEGAPYMEHPNLTALKAKRAALDAQ